MAVDAYGNTYTSLKETPEYQAMLKAKQAAEAIGEKLPAVQMPPPNDAKYTKLPLVSYLADVGAAIGEVMNIAGVGSVSDPGLTTGTIQVVGALTSEIGKGTLSMFKSIETKVEGAAKAGMSFTLKLVWGIAIIGAIGMILYLVYFV
jgi:hypothetical protein